MKKNKVGQPTDQDYLVLVQLAQTALVPVKDSLKFVRILNKVNDYHVSNMNQGRSQGEQTE